jgi:hypothetical protein
MRRVERYPAILRTNQRIRAYLKAADHAADLDGPPFRPIVCKGEREHSPRRHMGAAYSDGMLRRCARELEIEGRHSADTMHATFSTVALQDGAGLEVVQDSAGHADPRTMRLCDRRGRNPERSAPLPRQILTVLPTWWSAAGPGVGCLLRVAAPVMQEPTVGIRHPETVAGPGI